jgi:putative addiction module killer protein
VAEREIRKLELENGHVPFDDWFASLGDLRMQAAVDARLARVRAGNFGDYKGVAAGVFELRINVGQGLRVYYGEHRKQLVLLLGGGDKATQTRDINRAKQLWQQWLQFKKYAS